MAAGHEINLYYPEAAGGTFVVELHGTSTLTTIFSDYDCLSSTAARSISAAGRAKFYVKVLVDVEVKDSSGVTVDTLVAEGTRAEHVGVQSTAFTGTLDGGGSGAGGSIYLKELLDKWNTSADAVDFNVKETGTGSAVPLKTALANLRSNNAQIFNVKSPPYNATGDGVTNDTVAVLAAMTALNANGGGVLYFPAGAYLLSSTIFYSGSGGMTIQGEAAVASRIVSTNGSAAIIAISTTLGFRDISIETTSNTAVALSVPGAASMVVRDCAFVNPNVAVPQISLAEVTTGIVIGCQFSGNVIHHKINVGGVFCGVRVIGCDFYSPILAVTGGCVASVTVADNRVDDPGVGALIQVTSAHADSSVVATGNIVEPTGASTALISVTTSLGISVSESGNVIASNIGSVIDPVRLAGTSTGNVTSLSRKPNVTATTGTSAAPRVGAGMTTVVANGNFTINAPVHLDGTTAVNPWHGAECAIQVHNSTGGNITTTLNAAYKGVATGNLATAASRIFRFRYNNAGTVSGWIQQGAYNDVT
jgi:hypothetical protein